MPPAGLPGSARPHGFSQAKILLCLRACGVPAEAFTLLDREHAPVSPSWMLECWGAWLTQLPDECVISDALGRRPRYLEDGGDCDTITLSFYGHLVTGCWRGAMARDEHFGRLAGVTILKPRWSVQDHHFQTVFMDEDGELWLFEPQTGHINRPNVAEAGSMRCGLFA